MTKTAVYFRISLVFGCILATIASCAPPAAIPAKPVRSSAIGGTVTSGVVVAARPVGPEAGGNGIQPGLNDVMAALQERAQSGPFDATEFVIQRNDGSTTTIVTRVQDISAIPAEANPAAGFSAGDHVGIVRSSQTELVRQNNNPSH
jgi:hypothetical protein